MICILGCVSHIDFKITRTVIGHHQQNWLAADIVFSENEILFCTQLPISVYVYI